MRLGVLFSGGKDSLLALVRAREFHEIACLINVRSRNDESFMFHTPNAHLVNLQAEALGVPLISEWTLGVKELELDDLRNALIKAKNEFFIDGVVTGAVRSVYQATRVQRLCKELGLWCFNPLWLMDQEALLRETISKGFVTIISSISAYPLTKDLLGKVINNELIDKLVSMRDLINPAGEGGEIETTVIDAPLFSKRLVISESSVSFEGHAGIFLVTNAGLVSK